MDKNLLRRVYLATQHPLAKDFAYNRVQRVALPFDGSGLTAKLWQQAGENGCSILLEDLAINVI